MVIGKGGNIHLDYCPPSIALASCVQNCTREYSTEKWNILINIMLKSTGYKIVVIIYIMYKGTSQLYSTYCTLYIIDRVDLQLSMQTLYI